MAAAVAVCGLLTAACTGGGGAAKPGPTVPEETSSSTSSVSTVTTLDPSEYAVPETIDQAYVQKVVSAYDHVLGDAIRVLKRDGGLSDDFLKHLLAIYSPEEFEFQQKLWAAELDAGRAAKTPTTAADPATAVLRVVRADPTCVTAQVDRDFGPTLRPGESPSKPAHDHYLALIAKEPGRDPLGVNPTPWVLSFDGSKDDNSPPENSCGG